MTYQLGIDLGTTWTAAAIVRDGTASMVELSQRSTAVPSVVLVREDDSILVGSSAERRASEEPTRFAREFKRRMGDSTPLILGGTPYSAEAITARLLGWVIDEVGRQEGGPPDRLVLTHPANWGDYKLDLLRQAVLLAGISIPVDFLSEPEAAALHYASKERVEPGTNIGAFDLGGGTFDAAVLRKTEQGFEFLGQPEGIERLGGVDFDEAVFQHVIRSIGLDLAELDDEDPVLDTALRRLRADCVVAKEVLSADTDTSIPVMLPNLQTEVRLTRAEFESMIRPTLADTMTVTERAFESAGIGVDAIDRILLIGGSSRIPVVAEMLSARFGRPLAIDAHPKNAVAQGAALAAYAMAGAEAQVSALPETEPDEAAAEGAAMVPGVDQTAPPTAAEPRTPGTQPPSTQPPPEVPSELAPGQEASSSALSQQRTEELVGAVTSAEAIGIASGRDVGSAPTPPPAGARRQRQLLIGVGLVVAVLAAVVVALMALGGDDSGATAQRVETDVVAPPVATATTQAAAVVAPEATPTPTEVPPTPTEVAPTPTEVVPTPTEVAVVDGFFEGVRCDAVQDLCIDITDVRLQNGELLIDWSANFTPNVNDRNHAHFYWSNLSPLNAGAGGTGPWEVSDAQPHLAGTYGDAILAINRPPGADICVTVANPDHTVRDPAIYQCWEYPDSR